MWFSFLPAEEHREILHLSATHPHPALLLSQQTSPKGCREAQGDHSGLKAGGFHPGCFPEVAGCVFRSPKAQAGEAQTQGTRTIGQLH